MPILGWGWAIRRSSLAADFCRRVSPVERCWAPGRRQGGFRSRFCSQFDSHRRHSRSAASNPVGVPADHRANRVLQARGARSQATTSSRITSRPASARSSSFMSAAAPHLRRPGPGGHMVAPSRVPGAKEKAAGSLRKKELSFSCGAAALALHRDTNPSSPCRALAQEATRLSPVIS
jgi:hypothetical protein